MQVTGKCYCGAVSFKASVDPTRVVVCHCTDCQVFSGAPFRAVLPTPASDVEVTGQANQYFADNAAAICGLPRALVNLKL